MSGYYTKSLSSGRLRKCYEIAPPRILQYLNEEIRFVRSHLKPSSRVLELGCGYGRVLKELIHYSSHVVGIDKSSDSIAAARRDRIVGSGSDLAIMDASVLSMRDDSFDAVVCIQNGLSAFAVAPDKVVGESLRVARSGGRLIFSSYSESFWDERLNWFELQAQHGLIGEIDPELTGDGTIVCRDGFRATTMRPEDFRLLIGRFGVDCRVEEVDSSSVFCVAVVP